MPLSIGYMGTKKQIAPRVAEVAALAPAGPFLDLFSGMCAVATVAAPKRQVWCNDVQEFAACVATAFFTSQKSPLPPNIAIELVGEAFEQNKRELTSRFERELYLERASWLGGESQIIAITEEYLPNCARSEEFDRERELLNRNPFTFPYRLFSITFAGGYFSLQQCIEIDSLRYAADSLMQYGTISTEHHRWLILALCQALYKVSNSTGHFAQFLKVKERNVTRFVKQRNRSVWHEWKNALGTIEAVGTEEWRRYNYAIRSDAISLLKNLSTWKTKPAVIYADPPYTQDHYSRYYHVYETLILYDYPKATGVGRYRSDRFISSFSLRTKVSIEIDRLIEGCARLGAELILSYPENGLLKDTRQSILSSLKRYFPQRDSYEFSHQHSSLGGSKGYEKRPVTEIIFRGYFRPTRVITRKRAI